MMCSFDEILSKDTKYEEIKNNLEKDKEILTANLNCTYAEPGGMGGTFTNTATKEWSLSDLSSWSTTSTDIDYIDWSSAKTSPYTTKTTIYPSDVYTSSSACGGVLSTTIDMDSMPAEVKTIITKTVPTMQSVIDNLQSQVKELTAQVLQLNGICRALIDDIENA